MVPYSSNSRKQTNSTMTNTSTYSAHNKTVTGYPGRPTAAKVPSATARNPYGYEHQRRSSLAVEADSTRSHSSSSCYDNLLSFFLLILLSCFLLILLSCLEGFVLLWTHFCSKELYVQVDSASLSELNTTSTNLTASWLEISPRVIIPSSKSKISNTISCFQLRATVTCGGRPSSKKLDLVLARALPFRQADGSESIVRFRFELAKRW